MLPSCSKMVSTAAIYSFSFLSSVLSRERPLARPPVWASSASGRLLAGARLSPPVRRAGVLGPPSCSMRASIRPYRFCSGALTRPAIAVSGAMIAPSTWPRSTSSGGSVARLSHLRRRHRPALHDPAADREHARLARRVGERLRGRDHVAVRLEERDRARALEQREQRVGAGGLGRTARQRVLHDREARAALDQPRAERVDLRHRQAAVVGDEQRVGRAQPLGQLCDDLLLVLFLHRITSSYGSSPHGGGLEKRRCEILCSNTASGGLLPVERLPAVFGDWACLTYAGTASCSSSSSRIPRIFAGSTWMPGPIVVVSVTCRM